MIRVPLVSAHRSLTKRLSQSQGGQIKNKIKKKEGGLVDGSEILQLAEN